jgi:hypothetical protein
LVEELGQDKVRLRLPSVFKQGKQGKHKMLSPWDYKPVRQIRHQVR